MESEGWGERTQEGRDRKKKAKGQEGRQEEGGMVGPEAKAWEHSRNGDLGKMCALSKPGVFDLVAPFRDNHKFLEVF